jgi:hypothetical protein
MTRITLDVDNAHLSTLLLFLKTLNYIEVKKVEHGAASEQDEQEKLNKLNALAGAWSDDRTAEQIIAEIEEARVFNRSIEELKTTHPSLLIL